MRGVADEGDPAVDPVAQGAIRAIEDGWVLAEHVGRQLTSGFGVADLDWDVALSAYNAVRPEHCRRVLTTGRTWASCGTSTADAQEPRELVAVE